MLELASPGFRDFEEFLAASDAITLESDHQAVRRFLGSKAFALPGERPVEAIGTRDGIGFFGKELPLAQIVAHFCLQEIFGGGKSLLALQGFCRTGFCNLVLIAHDVSGRIDPNLEFFFLRRAEKTHLPIPDVQLAGHEAVGLFEAEFALEIGLGVLIQLENDGGLIASDVFSQAFNKLLCALLRGGARNLEIHRSFGKGAEIITMREEGA